MSRSPSFAQFRRRAAWLLAIGLFAMTLNAFGGVRLMRASSADGFYLQICGAAGKANPVPQPGENSPSHGGLHDCCTLCIASPPPLVAGGLPGVLPAPTSGAGFLAPVLIRPAVIVRVAHPPRGPPLV